MPRIEEATDSSAPSSAAQDSLDVPDDLWGAIVAILVFGLIVVVSPNGILLVPLAALGGIAALKAFEQLRRSATRRTPEHFRDEPQGPRPEKTAAAQTRANAEEWYYSTSDDTQTGPVSTSELLSLLSRGVLHADALVWSEGLNNWTPAQEVSGLHWEKPKCPPPLPKRREATEWPPLPHSQRSRTPDREAWTPTVPSYAAPPVYPPLVPDRITLTHVDKSARGRLMKVLGTILMIASFSGLAYGLFLRFQRGGNENATMLRVAFAAFAIGFAFRLLGSVHEYIYRRDR